MIERARRQRKMGSAPPDASGSSNKLVEDKKLSQTL